MTYDNLQQVTNVFEQKAREIGGGEAWIFKAKAKADQRNEIKSLLTKLDNIIGDMPDIERKKLTGRFENIIPTNAQQYKREYDDQFLAALVEVLGWGWLRDKYPSQEVQFLEPPDLIVKDNTGKRILAAMACKKIQTSDKDRDYFKYHQGEARAVDTRLTSPDTEENPLLRKVTDTLCKAEAQLSKVEAPDKFVFVDFDWDVSALIPRQNTQLKGLIKGLEAGLHERGITLIAFEKYQSDKPFTGA